MSSKSHCAETDLADYNSALTESSLIHLAKVKELTQFAIFLHGFVIGPILALRMILFMNFKMKEERALSSS